MRYRFKFSSLLAFRLEGFNRMFPAGAGSLAIDLVTNPEGLLLLLRKEVIQPQVPLRLPCYDFIPVTAHSLGSCLSCELAHLLREQVTPMM